MFEYFEKQKLLIAARLRDTLGGPDHGLDRVNRFGPDVRSRLLEFALRGKMIRGCLVRLGYELFRDDPGNAVVACGAALELCQSALLIHDDVMDRDTVRRGQPTLHARYTKEAQALADPARIGEALAVCAGDIGFFLAFRLLAESGAPATTLGGLIRLFAREMSYVGAAQMLDVWSGATPPDHRVQTEDEILSLYRYKTGRYTFSLPLSAGVLLAGEEQHALEAIGEKLGIIFQIKDDELGLFGEEGEIGKPAGSDIREGKNTLFFARLLPSLAGAERKRFLALWGNRTVSAADIEFVRGLVRSRGAAESVGATVATLAAECRAEIEAFQPPRPEMKLLLSRLLDYSLKRAS
jgi:geranylgeranyl diphosphate synthase type I